MVTVKALRDGAGAQVRTALGQVAWAATYNPRFEYKRPMAKHLDLEEQEQLDQLKHFWKQYGNLITWA
jgi:hypothetical protein